MSPDRVARGLPTGGQGSKVYVLCAEPKGHKHFRPGTRPGGSGTRPGGSVTGVTEKLFMCRMFMCLFRPIIMADEFNFLVENFIAEAYADLIPARDQLELHGRCRCGVLLSPCKWTKYIVADLIVGMKAVALRYRSLEYKRALS